MNREEKFLLRLCTSYLNDNSPEIDDIDWRSFYNLAKAHNLIGICHCVFNKNKELSIPNGVRQLFMDKFFDLVYIYECQSAALSDIEHCLTAAEISYILFKGSVLRNLYPVPESRSMGDIDILIRDSDRSKAKAVLENSGFECYAPNGTVREFKRNNIILEVHTKIISEFGDNAFNDAFENSVFDGCKGELNNDYHFAYLIAHIAHHFKFYGAGLKLILDLAVMLKKRNIDLNNVLSILQGIRLDIFAKEILTVCFKWFAVGKDYGNDTSKTEDYLLKCGAFGDLQKNKAAIVVRKDLEDGKKYSSFRTRLRLAFPPYSRLKNISYIRFIDGRPWLTPYAWIYRFFYNIKHKKQFLKETVEKLDENSSALAEKELKYFEEIGLIWHS